VRFFDGLGTKKSTQILQDFNQHLFRMNRSIQPEGDCGVIKREYGFRQFLSEGTKRFSAKEACRCFAVPSFQHFLRFCPVFNRRI